MYDIQPWDIQIRQIAVKVDFFNVVYEGVGMGVAYAILHDFMIHIGAAYAI